MKEKLKDISVLIIMLVSVLLVLGIAGYFLIVQYVDSVNQTRQVQQQATPSPTQETANWNTVKNDQLGFEFKYPADFGTKYASFQSNPTAIVTAQGNATIDSNGCYVINPQIPNNDSKLTINGVSFCLSVAEDPGAGQLYKTRDYTTVKNGNYITLQYVVHTLNGCSPYTGTPDYNPCVNFTNNYDSIVVKAIESSVATLTFTK